MGVSKKASGGAGCLVLFALPFAAVGVGALGMCAWTIASWVSMQSWEETPARIDRVELVESHSDDSTTYRVEAEYTYEWEGRTYRGNRVSVHTGSDNVGSFHQRVHGQLKERWSGNRPYHCYVNPGNPSEAVLYRDLRIGLLAFHLVFGTVFGGFGILLIWGVVSMAGRSARRSKHADQPWLVRKDWARGVMGASRLGFAVVTLIVAAVWGWVAYALVFVAPVEALPGGFLGWMVKSAFAAAAVLCLVAGVYRMMHWLRYGTTQFVMDTIPGVVGGCLRGRILVSSAMAPEGGAQIVLECLRGRRDPRETLWQTETYVPTRAFDREGAGTIIPVEIFIPPDQPQTDMDDFSYGVYWRLRAKMPQAGVNLAAEFEVPVFSVPQAGKPGDMASAPDGSGMTGAMDERGAGMASEERGVTDETGVVMALDEAGNPISGGGGPDPAQVGETLRRAGVLMEALPDGGIALVFPRMRHPGAAAGSVGLLAASIGAVALTIVLGLPVFASVVVGVSLLFPLWLALTFCLAQSRVEVGRRGIILRGGIFGGGDGVRLDFGDIAGFDVRETVKINNTPYCAVTVLRRGGGKGPRVAGLLRINAAQAVVDALETAVRDYSGPPM